MAHQYANESPKSGLEVKYQKVLQNTKEDFDQKKLQYKTVPRQDIIDSPDILEFMDKNRPNKSFTQSYNERAREEEEAYKREALRERYDKNGNLLALNWETDIYKVTHDPLQIYKKKGNYEDLAWKVFRSVDDADIFLKTLYFPRLTSVDHESLLHLYNDHYKRFMSRKRLTYLSVFGAGVAGWGLAYINRFKFTGFLGTTLGFFFLSKFFLDYLNTNNFKRNLNDAACKVANRYPAIKFSKIENVKGREVNLSH